MRDYFLNPVKMLIGLPQEYLDDRERDAAKVDQKPRIFRSSRHWLEAYLSEVANGMMMRKGVVQKRNMKEKDIWDFVSDILRDLECKVIGLHSVPYGGSRSSHGRYSVAIVSRRYALSAGDDKDMQWHKRAIWRRVRNELALQHQYEAVGGDGQGQAGVAQLRGLSK